MSQKQKLVNLDDLVVTVKGQVTWKIVMNTNNFSPRNTSKYSNVTRWIFGLLVVGFIWVVVTRHTQVETLVKILSTGRWEWVLVAVFFQAVYLIVITATYQSAFSTVEFRSRVIDLIPVVLGSLFMNIVAPSGGASGAVLFMDDAAQHGQPPARTAAGLILQLVSDFYAFSLLLIIGFIYLFFQHDLKTYEVVAALILLLITLFLSCVLMLGLWRPTLLRRMFDWTQGVGNSLASKLHRAPFLSEDWAEKNAADFILSAEAMSKNPGGFARTVGLAFVAYALNLVCLYVLFLAFYGPIHFGALVAGYATGILFTIVSITPQGVGVVEGIMALVFGSLGIPDAVAVTVTLAFRGLIFWLPLVLGFIALRRTKSFGFGERSPTKEWGVRIIALLTALVGFLNVLSAVRPAQAGRLAILDKLIPLTIQRGGSLTAALSGFALIILADGLGRRKSTAWLLTLVVMILSSISYLIEGLDYKESLLAAGLALGLLAMRRQFYARSDQPSVCQGIRTLCAGVLFTLVYGSLGFYLLERHYSVRFSLWGAVRQTIVMFTQFYNPGLQPVTGFGRYFATSIYVVGAATLLFALLMLIRPVIIRQPATKEERERARRIVEAYGRSSMARFTLFEDKSYFFNSSGAVVAFAAKERAAVALGDPIGPVEDIHSTIEEFKKYCTKNDWLPAFYQVLPDNLELYQGAGFDVLCIGHEGIVDVRNFTLEGKSAKDLRYSYNRFSRLGYQALVHEPPLADSLLEELHGISNEWLKAMHGTEKRFSLGWFEDDYIRNSVVMAVHTPDGPISAFANICPEYQRNEANVDLMRHRRDAESGTMDYLFISLFFWARSKGYDTFNLGLSGLSGVGENRGDTSMEKALHYIYEHINQFYNFKGLHEFKEKFRPSWSPRYLIYPGPGSLLPIVLTLIEADSGENPIQNFLKRKPSLEREKILNLIKRGNKN